MTQSSNTTIVVNPLWVTLGVSGLRNILQLAGAGAFATAHPDSLQQFVSGAIALGSVSWSLIAWYQAHRKTVAVAKASPEEVSIK